MENEVDRAKRRAEELGVPITPEVAEEIKQGVSLPPLQDADTAPAGLAQSAATTQATPQTARRQLSIFAKMGKFVGDVSDALRSILPK